MNNTGLSSGTDKLYNSLKTFNSEYFSYLKQYSKQMKLYNSGLLDFSSVSDDFFDDDIEFDKFINDCIVNEPYVAYQIDNVFPEILIKDEELIISKTEYTKETIEAIIELLNLPQDSMKAFYQKTEDNIPVYNPNTEEHVDYKFSGRRIKRGCYRTSTGFKINADVNGALNILKKYLQVAVDRDIKSSDIISQTSTGLVVNPVKLKFNEGKFFNSFNLF